jgi:hypothetical protein
MGPRAPRGRGGVCLLVSCSMRDPIGGAADTAAPKGQRLGAPEPWLVLKAGKEPRVRSRLSSVRSLGLGRAPGP